MPLFSDLRIYAYPFTCLPAYLCSLLLCMKDTTPQHGTEFHSTYVPHHHALPQLSNNTMYLSPACLPTPPHDTTSPCPYPFLPTHPQTADIPARIDRFDGIVCFARAFLSVRLVSVQFPVLSTHTHTHSPARPSVRLCIFPLWTPSNHFPFFLFSFFPPPLPLLVSVLVPPTNAGPCLCLCVPGSMPWFLPACLSFFLSACPPAYRLVPRVFVDTIGHSRQRDRCTMDGAAVPSGRCRAGLGWAGLDGVCTRCVCVCVLGASFTEICP
ncbi:hypothetical protein IWZ03DRAFT_55054 [Phyllosticta citriasiana]|uniref:Uncharacterized protein n=1 Tax=Phyllosticta citriasiana TaxID=595635 RepID=A0ABR1KF82_9PEZI